MPRYVGIEIGGTKLQLVVGDEATAITERSKSTVDAAGGAAGIRRKIEHVLPELICQGDIKAIGVGFGGPVDWRTGRICRSHQIEGWSEFDLGGWLEQMAQVPVVVDNDANVGAYGEASHGAGVGFDPVFYVTLGSGVGGGLVSEGRIYHGCAPGESEVGHVRLDRDGTIVENRCSGWAVDARIRKVRTEAPESILARITDSGGEAKNLRSALEKSDRVALQILQETAEDLAFGLSHAVHLFHPEIIILGGGLAGVGEHLRAAVQKALTGCIMEAFRPGLRLALAALGEDAVPVGAIQLARRRGTHLAHAQGSGTATERLRS